MPARDPAPPAAARATSWLDALCNWLAWLLPVGLALRALGSGSAWHDDLARLRQLGLIPAGSEGAVSTVATQLASLLPLGSQGARAGLVGALALGAAGSLAFVSWRRLLDGRAVTGLNPPLALLGSLLWTLSGPALASAEPGGGAVALCLVLLGLRVSSQGLARPRTLPLLGVVLGLCFGESHLAALALLLILIADAPWEGSHSELPWGYLAAGFALSAGTCLAVPWLRTWAPGSVLELGLQSLPGAGQPAWLSPAEVSSWRAGVQRAWWALEQPLGSAAGALALLGLGAALLHSPQRRAALPWALLALAGLLTQLCASQAGGHAGWAGLAIAAGLVAFVPLGLQLGLCWLWSRPVPFARSSSVLALAFAGTLVLQRLEHLGARPAPDPSGAEIWLDAALARLPARSALLVESPALGYRLLSAQLLGGVRPDVLTVPLPLLQRGTLSAELLRRAPELAPVLRQLAVQGWADEAALGHLAAERPLFVELDPRWSARLLAQLRPEGLWLAFEGRAPSALERRRAADEARAVQQRLRQELENAGALDAGTRAALAAPLRQRALLLAALGDNQLAAGTSRELLELAPGDGLGLELLKRLDRQQGRVALSGLLGHGQR